MYAHEPLADDETTIERLDTLADGDIRNDPEHAAAQIEAKEKFREAFARLPNIGSKTASRLTFFLLRAPDEETLVRLCDAAHYQRRVFNRKLGTQHGLNARLRFV